MQKHALWRWADAVLLVARALVERALPESAVFGDRKGNKVGGCNLFHGLLQRVLRLVARGLGSGSEEFAARGWELGSGRERNRKGARNHSVHESYILTAILMVVGLISDEVADEGLMWL